MSKKEYTINPSLEGKKEEEAEKKEDSYVNIQEPDLKQTEKAKGHVIEPKNGQVHLDIADITAIELDLDQYEEEVDEWGEHTYEDVDGKDMNIVSKVVTFIQQVVIRSVKTMQRLTRNRLFSILFLLAYTAYFVAAMIYKFGDDGSIRLLVCTVFGVIIISRPLWVRALSWTYRKLVGDKGMSESVSGPVRLVVRWVLYLALIGVTVWTIVESSDDLQNLSGLPGLFIFLILCLLFSNNPSKINWHTVVWGLGLQFLFGMCTLRYAFGRDATLYVQDRLDEYMSNIKAASKTILGPETHQHQMLLESLPVIFLVSATLSLLFYLGVIQFLIRVLGTVFSFIMDAQPAESMCVASSIFLEGTAAILSLRPYLQSQSKSQLFIIITSCFSSLGGTYLAMLGQFGVPLATTLPAMLISAPATFAVCKLIMPDTRPKDHKLNKMENVEQDMEKTNALDAFRAGALFGLPIFGNIVAVAISFISAISWLNATFQWFGERVGKRGLTLEYIMSYLLYPLALAMGIHPNECRMVARILGIRFLSSNFVAFLEILPLSINRRVYEAYMQSTNHTGPVMEKGDDLFLVYFNTTLQGGMITERSEVITTFSLCGFSSMVTMAFTIAVFYTLVPSRRLWMAKMAVPALIAGNITNCMTACVASMFYKHDN